MGTFTQEAPRPSLICATPRHDLGRIIKGAKVIHVFRLENRSIAPLSLKDVTASCDCTTAPLALKTLAPGQGVDLPVTFDSSTFEGPVEKSVMVVSDDPVRPVLMLELRATVVDRWTLAPATLALGPVSRFQRLEAFIHVTRNDGTDPVVRSAQVQDNPYFDAEVVPLPDQKAVKVILRLAPGLPKGLVRAKLLLALDDPEKPFREVSILGQLVDDVAIQPETLELGDVTPGAAASIPLRVTLHRAGMEVRNIEVEPAWISASVVRRKILPGTTANQGFTVRFRVAETAPLGAFQGRVRVKSSSPDQPELVVPLSGTVAQPRP